MSGERAGPNEPTRYEHAAVLYSGIDEFSAALLPFVEEAVANDEPILVAVSAEKIARFRAELGDRAGRVRFAAMSEIGRNPARIIPIWRAFVAEHRESGKRLKGIGEPVWAERSPSELDECHVHELLLNIAFDDDPAFTLLCPYDVQVLGEDVVRDALRSHPHVLQDDVQVESPEYHEPAATGLPGKALTEPESILAELPFRDEDGIHAVRALVREHAEDHVGRARAADVSLVVHEIAVNSITHGAGHGSIRLWHDGPALVCEVRDSGSLTDPLVGRVQPTAEGDGGRGVWLAHQLADLTQVRSDESGTTVRAHFAAA